MHLDTISKTLGRFLKESPIALTLASPGFDDCPIVLINDAFTRLTGYTGDFVLGRNCRFMQGADTEESARMALRRAIIDKTETVVPITNYRRDGSRFRNLVFLFPILDANGSLLYMLGSQYDVTAPAKSVSPVEHGQILDEVISINAPILAHKEQLRIETKLKLADLVSDVLDGSR
ncbi:MAG: PAS domain-containing protein [Hyphomicrobiaceae bacterium]